MDILMMTAYNLTLARMFCLEVKEWLEYLAQADEITFMELHDKLTPAERWLMTNMNVTEYGEQEMNGLIARIDRRLNQVQPGWNEVN